MAESHAAWWESAANAADLQRIIDSNEALLAILMSRGVVGIKRENAKTFLWFDAALVDVNAPRGQSEGGSE